MPRPVPHARLDMRAHGLLAALQPHQLKRPEVRGPAQTHLAPAQKLGQFHRRPADVAHQPLRPGPAQQHALRRKPRLFIPADDLDIEPGVAQHVLAEIRAVLGIAHRSRRHRQKRRHVHPLGQRREAPERGHRAHAALGVQAARLGEPGAEAAEDLFVEEIGRAARRAVEDDHPDGVRADVDHTHAAERARLRPVEERDAEGAPVRVVIVHPGPAFHRCRARRDVLMTRGRRVGQFPSRRTRPMSQLSRCCG
jgi:hypothetical protein